MHQKPMYVYNEKVTFSKRIYMGSLKDSSCLFKMTIALQYDAMCSPGKYDVLTVLPRVQVTSL